MAKVCTRVRQGVALGVAIGLGTAGVGGCAQIITRSTVEVMERPEASVLVLGGDGAEVTARGVEAEWTQDGDRLELHMAESRTCTAVRHVPVLRVERVDKRTARGAMWFEYGLGGAALAGGLTGLIKPEAFSQAQTTTPDGQVLQDTGSGYRIGGILTGIGVLLLTAAVVDTVRTRDEVRYTDAYRREEDGTVECREPRAPLQGRTVELLVGEWSTVEPTGDDGGVRFLLPAVEELPDGAKKAIEATAAWDRAKAEADATAKAAAEEAVRRAAEEAEAAAKKKGKRRGKGRAADEKGEKSEVVGPEGVPPLAEVGTAKAGDELGPRPEPFVVKGVLRIDSKRAMAVSFVVPYDGEAAKGHHGRAAVEPGPVGLAVGNGNGKSGKAGKSGKDDGDGGETRSKPLSLSAGEGSTTAPEGDDEGSKDDSAAAAGTER